jgi:TatD DNase family protein
MIDSHCHLADEAFAGDLEAVATRAREAGVSAALCILSADEPAELDRLRRVQEAWPAVRFASAVHPHRSGAYAGAASDAVAHTRSALDRAAAVAVGEIGLDYHYDFSPKPVQRDVFAAQMALAIERGLPVIIHTRDALDDTLAVVREAGADRVRAVIHCFTGTRAEARKILDAGLIVSLAGIVTFPKAGELRDVARYVPLDRLLSETDAPFLAPVPHRGERNEPAWVMHTLAELAAIRAQPAAELDDALARNFARFIGGAD